MSWRSWCSALALVGVVGVVGVAACSSSPEGAATTTGAPVTSAATVPAATPTDQVATVPDTVAGSTAVPAGTVPPVPPTTGVAPVGFERVAGRVTAADGTTCDVCLWLAADPAARAQGLMGVTDLSGADGMVFRWDEPTTGSFWMRDTPSPLSIAFFAADGTFVSATDMVPCLPPTPDAGCARYDAAGPYRYAVEVAVGGLGELLMTPGSRLELLAGGCPPAP